jgi:hypothetical protein
MICPVCEVIPLDTIKTGHWSSDDVCPICMEKVQRSYGLKTVTELNRCYNREDGGIEADLYALEALASVLTKNTRGRKINR